MKSLYDTARNQMVAEQLAARDIDDKRVLAAMYAVPRELFVPKEMEMLAYADRPLPIGSNQTISQPYIVALMAQALCLTGSERLLEVGGGCGYSAAIYGHLAAHVDSYEIIPELAELASTNLEKIACDNVNIIAGDATAISGNALYDAISVAAAPENVPSALLALLKKGGRMVIPIGSQNLTQWLMLISKQEDGSLMEQALCPVGFVPLI